MPILLFIALLFSTLLASEQEVLDTQQNFPLTSTTQYYTQQVNVISGEFAQQEVDIIIAGAEPLSLRRFYNHLAPPDKQYGNWRYNPEHYAVGNLEWEEQKLFLAVGAFEGGVCCLDPKGTECRFNLNQPGHFHTGSGQTHPANLAATYHKQGDPKDGKRFNWRGTITDGSGTTRHFNSGMHAWNSNLVLEEKNFFQSKRLLITPQVWTPFQLKIDCEERPNGNYLRYDYTYLQADPAYPSFPVLSKITAYNRDNAELSSLAFSYRKSRGEIKGMDVIGSDGRKVDLCYGGKTTLPLTFVNAPGRVHLTYCYQDDRLTAIERPDGRYLKISYKDDKVTTLSAPVGEKGAEAPLFSYRYEEDHTDVLDAENNQTTYWYDTNKRIIKVETENRIDENIWDEQTGDLLKKRILDAKGNCQLETTYGYDANHNLISEQTGERSIKRTYSNDGFNLLLSEEYPNGKRVCYTYEPNSNRLSTEFVYDRKQLKTRTFHSYDASATRIKTIVDDGHTPYPHDLEVTHRTITYITPVNGLPGTVIEKTLNNDKKEVQLHKTQYSYTPFGKVLEEHHYDANDKYCYTITNTYHPNELLASTTDPHGYTTYYTYDANHNLTLEELPLSHTEIRYDLSNRPIQIIQNSEQITDKTYDKLGRLLTETDEVGTTSYSYDNLGNITQIIHPDGGVTTNTYDIFGNLITQVDPNGWITQNTYNLHSELIHTRYPDGSEQRFSYNPDGTLASQTDKNGAITRYSYDIFGHPTQIETYGKGKLLKATYRTFTPFTLLSEVTLDGIETRYTYDYAGRKTSQTTDQCTISYGYDPLGRQSHTRLDDALTINLYDFKNQLIEKRLTDHLGHILEQVRYTYDAAGNQTSVITPSGTSTTTYDPFNRLHTHTDPLGQITTYSYTPNSQTTTTINHRTTTTYDPSKRPIQIITYTLDNTPLHKTEQIYDLCGNRIQATSYIYDDTTFLHTTTATWSYGPLGRVESHINPTSQTTTYSYDERGRHKTLTRPDQTTLEYHYDTLGRLIRFHSTDFDYRYTYDCHDRLLTATDIPTQTTTTRSYDALGNLTSETLANGLTLINQYDPFGNRTQLTLPDDSTIHYSYLSNRLFQVTRGAYTYTYSQRDFEGRPVTNQLPSSLGSLHYTRDACARLTTITSPFYSAQLSYHDNQLTKINSTDPLGPQNNHYGYDKLDQLTSETDQTYHFDSLGNLLAHNATTHTYNANCQRNDCQYDKRGNLLSDDINHYQFDSLNRLIQITTPTQSISFTYDPFNRRLTRTTKNDHLLYIWDEQNEIGSQSPTETTLRVLGEGLGAEIGAAVLLEINHKAYLPIHDYRGNLSTLIDLSTKTPTETYRYTAFGTQTTNSTLSPWRFASKRTEENLIYFGRRYYSPSQHLWTSPDPSGYQDGPNLYAYVHNDPLSQIDLYGLFSQRCLLNSFSTLTRPFFRGIEWTGQNLIPFGGVRDVIESIGRWGAGGSLFNQSAYRQNYNRIYTVEGTKQADKELVYKNGILTSFKKARSQAEQISATHGGAEVTLLYNGTHGGLMDIAECVMAKMGLRTPIEKMSASYYSRRLAENPNTEFITYAHSQGGSHMSNVSKLLTPAQRAQISLYTFGSATIVPQKAFGQVTNFISRADMVPMTNPFKYVRALHGKDDTVRFLTPSSASPLQEHFIQGGTYGKQMKILGENWNP